MFPTGGENIFHLNLSENFASLIPLRVTKTLPSYVLVPVIVAVQGVTWDKTSIVFVQNRSKLSFHQNEEQFLLLF